VPVWGQVLQPPMRRVAARWLRSTGRDAAVQLRGIATQSEPPQVNGLPVARIQWHRTPAAMQRPAATPVRGSAGDLFSGHASQLLTASCMHGYLPAAPAQSCSWKHFSLASLRAPYSLFSAVWHSLAVFSRFSTQGTDTL
jgi:hypothetical protein